MESLSLQVVSAAKLPILNPNEFDLWKIMIDQYFLMTDYSLCEIILNGDSSAPIRVIEGVLQPLKFNTHKDAKTLMEAIEKRLQKLISQLEILGVSLSQEDINLNLKIYKAEVKSSSSASTSIQNIAFVSSSNTDSTNEPVSAAASVAAVSAKIPVSALLNVDTLRRNLRANGPTFMGFDMSKVECYNCHRKGHFVRECRFPKDTRRNGAAEPQRRNVPIETSTSNALLRDNALVVLRQNLEKADQEKDDLKLKLEKFQTSSKNLRNGYHAVPPSYIGTFMPPKPDLFFHDAPNVDETIHTAFNVKLSPTKPDKDMSPTTRPLAHIIEDCVSNSEDDSKTKIP
nr:retrovirus-related Pol polyprotein from transposon TNT 1-94 [Tanacetum cinerariifolium]